MKRKWISGNYKIFRTLKQLLQTTIEGYADIVAEIDQSDTYYLVRLHPRPRPDSYFASLQIRSEGVYLQLHSFSKPASFESKYFPLTLFDYMDPDTKSIVFNRPDITVHEELIALIQKAYQTP